MNFFSSFKFIILGRHTSLPARNEGLVGRGQVGRVYELIRGLLLEMKKASAVRLTWPPVSQRSGDGGHCGKLRNSPHLEDGYAMFVLNCCLSREQARSPVSQGKPIIWKLYVNSPHF